MVHNQVSIVVREDVRSIETFEGNRDVIITGINFDSNQELILYFQNKETLSDFIEKLNESVASLDK